MGILNKFNDPDASKKLEAELKSKVGITSNEDLNDEISAENNVSQQNEKGGKQKEITTKGSSSKKESITTKGKEEINKKEALSSISEKKPDKQNNQDDFDQFLENFAKTYKNSEKENRMLRLQKKNYKNVLKLKLDNIAISEFVNFAIHFTIKSKEYDRIIKFLKSK